MKGEPNPATVIAGNRWHMSGPRGLVLQVIAEAAYDLLKRDGDEWAEAVIFFHSDDYRWWLRLAGLPDDWEPVFAPWRQSP